MDKEKEDRAKRRRKVGTACIYCRRSHMTCDEARPCKRCIKRDIGHLCHDESTSSRSQESQSVTGRGGSLTSNTSTTKAQSPTRNAVSSTPTNSIAFSANNQNTFVGAKDQPTIALNADRTSTSPNLTTNFDASTQLGLNSINWGNTVLGGAGFLGLGGAGFSGLDGGDVTASGDAAGGNEFNILSEYLESLDGTTNALSTSAINGIMSFNDTGNNSTFETDMPLTSFSRPSSQTLIGGDGAAIDPASAALTSLPQLESGQANGNSTSEWSTTNPLNVSLTRSHRNSVSDVPLTSSSSNQGTGMSSKAETFFLTAADQKDGTRDERLGRVIEAKYDAGLLRPYNHVNGYSRLNRWMEQNVSQASRRRILKPLSIFRPAFRAIAQSLTNVDLIFIEEAFERLLLDYDRVFSTQGIPACLWRRTGEIYKGNKEFAELVGVGIEALRDGRCTIYELMQEESAVNYWEKYGAVSFDPGQKAVLTSCVLKTKANANKREEGGVGSSTDKFVSCCFSFTIRRDAWSIPCLIVGNFLPIQEQQ